MLKIWKMAVNLKMQTLLNINPFQVQVLQTSQSDVMPLEDAKLVIV